MKSLYLILGARDGCFNLTIMFYVTDFCLMITLGVAGVRDEKGILSLRIVTTVLLYACVGKWVLKISHLI